MFSTLKGNLVSQMASGFGEKSGFARMTTASRVSPERCPETNFHNVQMFVQFNLPSTKWCCYRAKQDREDFRDKPEHQ